MGYMWCIPTFSTCELPLQKPVGIVGLDAGDNLEHQISPTVHTFKTGFLDPTPFFFRWFHTPPNIFSEKIDFLWASFFTFSSN